MMKKAVLTILLTALVQFAYGQSDKIKTAEIRTEIHCDHCADCKTCDENIYAKIKRNNPGVRSVKIDAKSNLITVKYNTEKTNLEAIEKAIAQAGYQANELPPTAAGYESLDSCCKVK